MHGAPGQVGADYQCHETEDGDTPLKRPLPFDRLRLFGDPLELKSHVVRGLDPLIRILRQARADQSIERRSGVGRRWLMFEDRGNQARLARAGERRFAGDHLVQHQPKGEDVAARIGFFPMEQLRRHVLNRPEDFALLG